MLCSCHVWGQVNADVVDLVRLTNGSFVKFSGSSKSVGQFISTKAVGSDDRHDITHQYKYPEGIVEVHILKHTYHSLFLIVQMFSDGLR